MEETVAAKVGMSQERRVPEYNCNRQSLSRCIKYYKINRRKPVMK